MIRMLTEGVRRTEQVQRRIDDLPREPDHQPVCPRRPAQGTRAEEEGRIVPLSVATARSFAVYLRARRDHRRTESSPAMWLGTRNRGPMTAAR
jgi:hypothetical protein